MRALLVDDEQRLMGPVKRSLERQGWTVEPVTTGERALAQTAKNDYDVIILDLVLPDMDGIAVCQAIRQLQDWTPILLVTGRGPGVENRVAGLDAGADDFLCKPFDLAEFLARVRALARRRSVPRATALQVDDLILDPATMGVQRGDVHVSLSSREFALLAVLMQHPGQVLPRSTILASVWGHSYDGTSNIVDVYVRYLRQKIDLPFGCDSIEAIRGVGYRMKARHGPTGGTAA